MLAKALAKLPHVLVRKVALQDLKDTGSYDLIVCIDAMENMCPEDWPPVLGNFRRALRPGGHLYFTVELATEAELRMAHAAGLSTGLPVVMGEWAHEGGCHYYPTAEQVHAWLTEAGFSITASDMGDGYDHYVVTCS